MCLNWDLTVLQLAVFAVVVPVALLLTLFSGAVVLDGTLPLLVPGLALVAAQHTEIALLVSVAPFVVVEAPEDHVPQSLV